MRLIDVTGQVFGRLRVVKKSEVPSMWDCVCTCGGVVRTTGTNLRMGNTTSCGCLHREQLAKRNAVSLTLEPWLADMKLYVRKLSYRMKRNGLGSNQFHTVKSIDHPTALLPWALSLESYIKLVTEPCFYCGARPNQIPHGTALKRMGVRRNGIDRVDNTKGYDETNCVTCCRVCNWEKGAQTQTEFIENTRRRYEHLEANGRLPCVVPLGLFVTEATDHERPSAEREVQTSGPPLPVPI